MSTTCEGIVTEKDGVMTTTCGIPAEDCPVMQGAGRNSGVWAARRVNPKNGSAEAQRANEQSGLAIICDQMRREGRGARSPRTR